MYQLPLSNDIYEEHESNITRNAGRLIDRNKFN